VGSCIGQSNLVKIFDSFHDFEAFEKHARSFEQIAAETWATRSQILSGRGLAREIKTIPVSVWGKSGYRTSTYTKWLNEGGVYIIADEERAAFQKLRPTRSGKSSLSSSGYGGIRGQARLKTTSR
jgi:hypothetical protein